MVLTSVWKCIEKFKSDFSGELFNVDEATAEVSGGWYDELSFKDNEIVEDEQPYSVIKIEVTKPHCIPIWLTFENIEEAKDLADALLKIYNEIKGVEK